MAIPTLMAVVLTSTAFGFRPTFQPAPVSFINELGAPIGGDGETPVRNETAFGLNTTTFDTLVGTVTVNLPDDLAAGDTISGTVISESKKTTDSGSMAVKKNQPIEPPNPSEQIAHKKIAAINPSEIIGPEINGYVVEVADQPAPRPNPAETEAPCLAGLKPIPFLPNPDQSLQKQTAAAKNGGDPISVCKKWSIPKGVSKIPIVLKNKEGKIVSRAEVPVAPGTHWVGDSGMVGQKADVSGTAGEYLTPPVGQAGKPISVKGAFDGDFANTAIKLGNQTAKFLASSPRKVVVESPRDLKGVADIEVNYKGKIVAKCVYRSLSIRLAADKLNLIKGEQTILTVTVSGLAGITGAAWVQWEVIYLSNRSPGTVSMQGGETQTINISPAEVNGDTFTATRTLTGVSAGGFSISAVLEEQDRHSSSPGLFAKCDTPSGNPPVTPMPQPSPGIPYGQRLPPPPPPPSPTPTPDIDDNGNPRTNSGPGQPPALMRGRFRVTLNGFTVNHVTNHGFGQRPDMVTFHPMVGRANADGTRPPSISGGDTYTIGMTPENPVQGGTSSPNGGFQTNDGFPTQTAPWQRTLPRSAAPLTIPPTVYFEGEIIQNTDAAWIIPNIWSVDGATGLNLLESYRREVGYQLDALGRTVGRMIRSQNGFQPLALPSYLKPGADMGLNNTLTLDSGVMQDRPIGMYSMGPARFGQIQGGFRPQVLVLTYDSAEFMSHTSFGFGPGIVPVHYTDATEFGGEYTLYLQVERLDTAPPCADPITGSHFIGTAELTTTRAEAPGPYRSDVNLTIEFTDCASTIHITNFPPLTSNFETSLGSNTATTTLASGGTGRFISATGAISLPITLLLRNSLGVLGNSTLPMTLTGTMDRATGRATLRGTGRFSGGQLGTSSSDGTIVVSGIFSSHP